LFADKLVLEVGVEKPVPTENTEVIENASRSSRSNRSSRKPLARIRHTAVVEGESRSKLGNNKKERGQADRAEELSHETSQSQQESKPSVKPLDDD
jgi:hypothetical protein